MSTFTSPSPSPSPSSSSSSSPSSPEPSPSLSSHHHQHHQQNQKVSSSSLPTLTSVPRATPALSLSADRSPLAPEERTSSSAAAFTSSYENITDHHNPRPSHLPISTSHPHGRAAITDSQLTNHLSASGTGLRPKRHSVSSAAAARRPQRSTSATAATTTTTTAAGNDRRRLSSPPLSPFSRQHSIMSAIPASPRSSSPTSGRSLAKMNSIDSSATAKPPPDGSTDGSNASTSFFVNGYMRSDEEAERARQDAEEDLRAENMATIQDLKDRLRKMEMTNEDYQKQLEVMQVRLDEAVAGQTRLEDLANESTESLKTKNKVIRELEKKILKMETQQETERAQVLAKEEETSKEKEELHLMIQRLKDNISQKDLRSSSHSSSPRIRSRPQSLHADSPENGQSVLINEKFKRSPSRNNLTLVMEKDRMIENLRLELAEAQMKAVQLQRLEGGQVENLQRQLKEVRQVNARLSEESESYQLLLSERTLAGTFRGELSYSGSNEDAKNEKNQPRRTSTSLADELESADDTENDTTAPNAITVPSTDTSVPGVSEGDHSKYLQQLESEISSLKDQNKALTLYIEKIISRLLQHDGFESILDRPDRSPVPDPAQNSPAPAPPSKPRASVSARFSRMNKPRPLSQVTSSSGTSFPDSLASGPSLPASSPTTSLQGTSSTLENPQTAPSIPFGANRARMHRRVRSDQIGANQPGSNIAQALNRSGNSPGGASMSPEATSVPTALPMSLFPGSDKSPTHAATASVRSSVASANPSVAPHTIVPKVAGDADGGGGGGGGGGGEKDKDGEEAGREGTLTSAISGKRISSPSVRSERTGELCTSAAGGSSPPRSIRSNATTRSSTTAVTAGVTTQHTLRPLTLVTGEIGKGAANGGNSAARKKANRASWLSWFQKKDDGNAHHDVVSEIEERE